MVVHCFTIMVSKFNGRLIVYICCMVSTIYFFNFSLVSKLATNLLFVGFQFLNTCFSLALLWVVIWTFAMLIEALGTFTLSFKLVSIILPLLFLTWFTFHQILNNLLVCVSLSYTCDKYSFMVLEVYQLV